MDLKQLCDMENHDKQKEENLEKLSKRLKEIRIAKGFNNYEQFAFKNDISRSQYGRYENGQDMRFSSLCRVLKALDITLAEFFEGFEED
jgi:transcriptional regulator with XRE-family HTH domain